MEKEENKRNGRNLKSKKPDSYKLKKDQYLDFKSGKKKVKLRKHLSDLAKELTKVNDFTYSVNKNSLIQAFNENGMDGVAENVRLFIK